MELSNFRSLRLNSEKQNPVFMDIAAFDEGCSNGFMVVAYEIGSMPKEMFARHKVEVRKRDRQIALIAYKYDDSEIPEWWRNAEILYSWTEPYVS